MTTTTSRRMIPGITVLAGLAAMGYTVAFLGGCSRLHRQPAPETAFGRITRTRKIRAAWMNYPPALMKDASTGKMTGTFADILNAIANNNGMTVEWMPTPTDWPDQVTGLNSGAYDIVGSPVWANSTRSRFATLSAPAYYSAYGIYVRPNDPRFADAAVADVSKRDKLINDSSLRISVVEDAVSDQIAEVQYPLAKRLDQPHESSESVLFAQVADNKADLLFANTTTAYEYQKANPGKLKNIAERFPVRVLANCFMFRRNEFQLKGMIDTTLNELLNGGYVNLVLSNPAYEKAPDFFYRIAYPYQPGK